MLTMLVSLSWAVNLRVSSEIGLRGMFTRQIKSLAPKNTASSTVIELELSPTGQDFTTHIQGFAIYPDFLAVSEKGLELTMVQQPLRTSMGGGEATPLLQSQ